MGRPSFEILGFEPKTALELPLYLATAPAGFPSPAEDYIDKKIDLNEHLVRHPAATFFVRVDGDSMRDAGVASGDILVVDRALEAKDGSIVVAALDGELTVKRLKRVAGQWHLAAENADYPTLPIGENDCEIWGVVTTSIRRHCGR